MIGIFDSGIGGLSLYLKAKEKLPEKGFIYLSDDSNFPYGEKSEDEIIALAEKNIELLVSQGAKTVLVACNSATVSSNGRLRQAFDLPIVGVEPGIKMAHDQHDKVGILVLATKRTVESHRRSKESLYEEAIIKEADDLVSLIETKYPDIKDVEIKKIIDKKITPETKVIVLGCTHYLLIKDKLKSIYKNIEFVAPEDPIVKQLSKFVDCTQSSREDIFLTSGDLVSFKLKLERILDKECDVRAV